MKHKGIIGIGVLLVAVLLLVNFFLNKGSLSGNQTPEDPPAVVEPPEVYDPPVVEPVVVAEPTMDEPLYDIIEAESATAGAELIEPGAGPVDELIEAMESANIAFNAPANINISDSSQIQLIVSLSDSIDELKRAINEDGEQIGAAIKVSDRMEARLTGHQFQITAITPETQAVSGTRRTEWQWEVHPTQQGQHKLHLTLTALLEVNGHTTPHAIRTFSQVIEVDVRAYQKLEGFFKSHWQWLWAAVLLPVAGWLWNLRKKIPA